jgi:hypothetical protein
MSIGAGDQSLQWCFTVTSGWTSGLTSTTIIIGYNLLFFHDTRVLGIGVGGVGGVNAGGFGINAGDFGINYWWFFINVDIDIG